MHRQKDPRISALIRRSRSLEEVLANQHLARDLGLAEEAHHKTRRLPRSPLPF